MAQFKLENELSNALSHNAPLRQGPAPRWQKKTLQDTSSVDMSFNTSSNNSTLNISLNRSAFKANPSPGRNVSSLGVGNAKTSTKSSKSPIDELTRRLTPGRKSDRKSPLPEQMGDRFIPNRSAMQFDLAHYMVTKGSEDENLSPNSSHYRKTMSENLLGEDISNCRILAYQNKAPQAPTGHANALKILYSSTKNPGSTKKATRHIPQNPDRILDAPEILDDYYLNLIDWSSANVLAVALHGSLYLWNASSGEINQLLDMPEHEEYISSVSWLNEGNVLAVGISTSEIQLWDVSAEKRIRTMKSHTTRVPSLSWNSYILSSGSRTGVIHHHDVRVSEHHVGTLINHTQEICGLKWSLDGRYLASGGNDNLVNIWSADAGVGQTDAQPLHTFNEHQAAVKALAWCPWQPNILASGGGTADRHIRFWNCNLGTSLNSIDAKSQVCAILWSKEYKELISGHGFANNELIIWKYPSMAKVAELIGHKSRILNLAMSPDGKTVVSAGADETLRLWNCFASDPKKKKSGPTSSSNKSEMMKFTIR
ncbi:cell division cycle protein 20 homolog [Parasteatoda tepidariorum]|uniref:cell division cycle protein 20 homolog n=1 Tax=Parasteatoda tepidariorum TaxID=114398 RepID=UPI000A2C03FC